ncbi:hypothetical protein KI387_039239 [Taxus chinensis]|uniref:BTB/POZ domain-containing protein n=1 Tax=Taxus chinensis TaxID=29808 RepID=A0AA38CAF5_TAXCH|nr:hypothetical protein KI387_039239 [Taxus chinensis]
MEKHASQLSGGKNADLQLRIISSDGVEYDGNPLNLHSQVLKKSKYFEAWSPDMSSCPEIKLTVPSDGSAENYIKCIGLMYSSHSGKDLSFSDVDEALQILPVASELLFEEGIEASMEYLAAVCWTPQQKLKLTALLSSLQVNISADLAERLKVLPESSFDEEIDMLKMKLPEMLCEITDCKASPESCFVPFKNDHIPSPLPLHRKKITMERYIVANFEEDVPPAIQNIFRETLLNKCKLIIEGIKYGNPSEGLLWLLDVIKLCKREMFESAFKIFAEDAQLANIILKPQTERSGQSFEEDWQNRTIHLLDVLVDRFLKALANGEIIIPKSMRISFLILWVPVMIFLLCRFVARSPFDFSSDNSSLEYSKRFEEGVTKVIGSVPVEDQKRIFNSCQGEGMAKVLRSVPQNCQTPVREMFEWWINVIWLGVMKSNCSHFQIE